MLNLQWMTCGDDRHWCSLANLDLASVTGHGVYIIWHAGNPARVVRIGQGDVAARLGEHRGNPEITQYSTQGTLRVTWAVVPQAQRDGVERYLADLFHPLLGEAFPNVPAVEVNLPW